MTFLFTLTYKLGSGLGKSLSKKLAKLDATLILWDIDEAANNQTKSEIERDGGKAYSFKCDLTNRDEVYNVAREVFSTLDLK